MEKKKQNRKKRSGPHFVLQVQNSRHSQMLKFIPNQPKVKPKAEEKQDGESNT